MNNINSEKEKWNKQKSMGKKKFILVYGVLLWVCGSILYGILTIFFNPNPINYNILGVIFRFITYAIIFGLCGIVYGVILWTQKVRKFDRI